MKARRTPTRKYFTVEQANQMLPLVKAIVSDIVQLAEDLHERQWRLRRTRSTPGRGAMTAAHQEELQEMEQEFARDASRLEGYLDELRKLGVEFKGWDGLVDFPGWQDGREICLCWKLGEPEVAHWHEVDAGFTGRQPLMAGMAGPDSLGAGLAAEND